jgi:RecA-family ATPase
MNEAPPFDEDYLASLDAFGEPNAWRSRPRSRPALKIFSADDLVKTAAPERRWLVPDMIPQGRVTLLYGNGGDGKSLLELQLAIAVAPGTDWIGRMPQQGRALLVSAEDDVDDIHRRLDGIIAGRADLNIGDLSNLKMIDLTGQDAILAFPDNRGGFLKPAPLFAEIERFVDEHRPIMLGIDTLADVYGGDENIRAQARQFIGLLTGLAIRYDMAIVILAHPSLSGMTSGRGTSGNTAWSNSVRSRLYLAPVDAPEGSKPDPALRRLMLMKSNYGPAGESISLRWDRGRFVVVGEDWKTSLSSLEIDQLFLNLLEQFTREGRNVTAKKGTSYAPNEFAGHVDARGVGKQEFRLAMDRLLGARRIENVEEGAPSRRKSNHR